MDPELEELRKKKMAELKTKYMNGGKKMENEIDAPLTITDADFDSSVKKYRTFVIDCWAAWCGPCRMIAPIISDLAKEMQGKIVFGKLNVDENPQLSMKFQIMSIPTLLIFKNGNLIDRMVGALPKQDLKKKLETYL